MIPERSSSKRRTSTSNLVSVARSEAYQSTRSQCFSPIANKTQISSYDFNGFNKSDTMDEEKT